MGILDSFGTLVSSIIASIVLLIFAVVSFLEIARRIPRPLRSGRKPTTGDTNHARWQGRLPHG